MKIELFYDKDCPFCKSYANYIKLKKSHELVLFNARQELEKIEEFKTLGFDINNGFIIRVEKNKIYQGVYAIEFLNDLAENKIFFPNNYFFRNIIYPIIKQFRKFILIISKKRVKI